MEQLRAEVERLRRRDTEQREVIAQQAELIDKQATQIAELRRRVGKNSRNSSQPPGSDSPYHKPKRSSSRGRSGRKPGKQRGDPGSTMPLVDNPDEVQTVDPGCCRSCGADTSAGPVTGFSRRQVTDVPPPPPPWVTEYRIVARACPCCGTKAVAAAPGLAPARAQYGPRLRARAVELVCAHYLPVGRAAGLISSLLGVGVSTGFVAGVRARAARLLENSFLPRVRELLATAGVIHADETPARADGGLEYVHVAATEYLTALHTGGRAKADIDAGGVLPGYAGTLVRDGYAGYAHLIDAAHAWCGAHLLRDLRAVYQADPQAQQWADSMATVLTHAQRAVATAHAAGNDALDENTLATIRTRYRGVTRKGLSDNHSRDGPLARDAAALARRFRDHEDMILRFVANFAVPFTNNQAERDIRPVKVQQRSSGGAWRTLQGLADFAVVQSYLSTATKWGIDTLDALEQLFTTGPWLPPSAQPC